MSFYTEHRPEQVEFYRSNAWTKCRAAYFKKKKGLCEICLSKGLIKQGEIVHHKIEMNAERIHDPVLAFGEDNLQLVCRDCHAEIHAHKKMNGRSKRYTVDDQGRVIVPEDIKG